MKMQANIKSEEVSVVVQGPVRHPEVAACLRSIRQYLPDAEIILSTWKGCDCSGLDYDVLITNVDPGPADRIRILPFEQENNCNRQIISTVNGILKARRKYVLKLRSDMVLRGRGFMEFYRYYGYPMPKDAVFSQRIMVNANTTPLKSFVIGDWWQFGLREDMFTLWNIPLYPEKKGHEYFLDPKNDHKRPKGKDMVCRFYPEKWVAYQCYLKFGELKLEHAFDSDPKNMPRAVKFMQENFLTIEHEFSDIILPKNEKVVRLIRPEYYENYRREVVYINSTCGKIRIPPLRKLYYQIRYALIKHRKRVTKMIHLYMIRGYAKTSDINMIHYEKITDDDVTFVLCGLIDDVTKKSLIQIRKFYPASKIILSVDDQCDLSSIEKEQYDKLIRTPIQQEYLMNLSYHLDGSRKCTYNKQQTEVRNGLLAVQTKYAVRLRSDCCIQNNRLFDLYESYCSKYPKTLGNWHLFEQKIMVPDHITGIFPGFISDCFALGLTSDMLKLYNGRFMSEENLVYFRHPQNRIRRNPNRFAHRFTCEQIFYFSLLKEAKREIKQLPMSYCEWSTEQVLLYEKYLLNNFFVTSFKEMGVNSRWGEDEVGYARRFLEKYVENVDPLNEEFDKLYALNKS